MSSSAQRKRRTTGSPLGSRPSTKTTRAANTSRAANASRVANANRTANLNRGSDPTETINVMDNTEDSVEEVVDLTREGSEAAAAAAAAAAVVDLTNNDSVLLVSEGESYVVSSDEDEASHPGLNSALFPLQDSSSTRLVPGMISCPVCMDLHSEIVESGRLVVSTNCGHVFCSQCLRDALSMSHTCPTCRKKLKPRQYHPLYI